MPSPQTKPFAQEATELTERGFSVLSISSCKMNRLLRSARSTRARVLSGTNSTVESRFRPATFHPMSVQEIEKAIERLSDEEVAELRAWLFDRQIARDAAAGRLDSLADEALNEARSGRTRPL